MTIRLFILSRRLPIQKKIKASLQSVPDCKVVGEARGGAEAIRTLRQFQETWLLPDILLVVTTAFEQEITLAIEYSRQHFQSVKVMVLNDLTDDAFLIKLLHLNIRGCLSHHISMTDLRRSIRSIHQGYSQLDSILINRIIPKLVGNTGVIDRNGSHQNSQAEPGLARLSSRELEVLQLIAQGANNQEIAQRLFIAQKTVKNHITQIFKKLAINNRTQAAIVARKYIS